MKTFLIVIISAMSFSLCAQTVDDVLTNGVRIKNDRHLLLDFDGTDIEYFVKKEATFNDSTLFLVTGGEIKIYMKLLNPLNYSCNSNTVYYTDPIDKAADEALNNIITGLQNVLKENENNISNTEASFRKAGKKVSYEVSVCDQLNQKISSIKELVEDNKKQEIINLFKQLKNISFNMNDVSDKLLNINKEIKDIQSHFDEIDKELVGLSEQSDGLKNAGITCFTDNEIVNLFIYTQIVKDIKTVKENNYKRLASLKKAYNLLDSVDKLTTLNFEYKKGRYIELDKVELQKGKNSCFTVSINKSGYELSENEEIVATESVKITQRNALFRRYYFLVPEVLPGTAYTFMEHKKYGTEEDASGQQHVTEAGVEQIRNLNATAMINWVFCIPSIQVHPFLQMGLGANTNFPTLLLGGGFRFNINSSAIKSLNISGGITALSWYKTLDKLKVGDIVSGTADIEKDYKYEFSFPPKPYIGIQLGF
jgi:predicted  nucleic acid-binding Zn-ribbon protein